MSTFRKRLPPNLSAEVSMFLGTDSVGTIADETETKRDVRMGCLKKPPLARNLHHLHRQTGPQTFLSKKEVVRRRRSLRENSKRTKEAPTPMYRLGTGRRDALGHQNRKKLPAPPTRMHDEILPSEPGNSPRPFYPIPQSQGQL